MLVAHGVEGRHADIQLVAGAAALVDDLPRVEVDGRDDAAARRVAEHAVDEPARSDLGILFHLVDDVVHEADDIAAQAVRGTLFGAAARFDGVSVLVRLRPARAIARAVVFAQRDDLAVGRLLDDGLQIFDEGRLEVGIGEAELPRGEPFGMIVLCVIGIVVVGEPVRRIVRPRDDLIVGVRRQDPVARIAVVEFRRRSARVETKRRRVLRIVGGKPVERAFAEGGNFGQVEIFEHGFFHAVDGNFTHRIYFVAELLFEEFLHRIDGAAPVVAAHDDGVAEALDLETVLVELFLPERHAAAFQHGRIPDGEHFRAFAERRPAVRTHFDDGARRRFELLCEQLGGIRFARLCLRGNDDGILRLPALRKHDVGIGNDGLAPFLLRACRSGKAETGGKRQCQYGLYGLIHGPPHSTVTEIVTTEAL